MDEAGAARNPGAPAGPGQNGGHDARRRREARTVRVMIGIHCRDLHGSRGGLCADCEGLWQYCQARVDRCPFYPDKPTCKNCRVHCYSPERRERIKEVMRYAGPRMMWQAPVLALLHMLDGRRSAPEKAPRARKQP